MSMRKFHLERFGDVSGVSGVGFVAEGCLFIDTGEVVIHWLGKHSSLNIYHSIDDVEFIHGHGGLTKIVFDDPDDSKGN